MFKMGDESILDEMEKAELSEPSARKITDKGIIFEHFPIVGFGPLIKWMGGPPAVPTLCDFGEARTGSDKYTGLIQQPVYRAPEVFLQLPWNSAVDVWNLGCMVR
jgi:serine/threonine-protein kinase SRPK3